MKNKRKYFIVIALITLLIGTFFCLVKCHKESEKERQLNARFDRFVGYYYPYLKEIASAADIYKRMQISLMYDYYENQNGRYIYETVRYYDGGGYFSMREHFKLEKFLRQAELLTFCRAYGPINAGTTSREKEKTACYKILWTSSELHNFDIYDEDVARYGVQRSHEILDSLNLEIQNSLLVLADYKKYRQKIDFNYISEADYDLSNY